jgi:Tol biopolymer transport system component
VAEESLVFGAKGAGALYGAGFGGADLLKIVLVAVAVLAICHLAFVETTNKAGAAPPDENGRIAFTHTFYHEASEVRDIYTANADGSDLTNLTASTDTSVSESDPAWSPNGSKIAFSSDLNSKSALGSNDIYVMDADGSNSERLTNNDYRFQGVGSWSPDGSKMTLSCYRSVWEVCTMDVDGSDHTQLTSGGGEGPTWSPDGTKLAFSGIHTMNPDGSNKTLAIAGGDQPDWSPDGTKIVYRRYPPGQSHSDIFIANADGSNPINLTARISNTSYEAVPAWSPDGAQIAFASNLHEDALHYEIYVIDANGRNLNRLTRIPGTNWDPDWQPLSEPTEAKPEKRQEERQQNQQQQQGSKSRSGTVRPPDTGGPSLILAASALLFSGSVVFYAVVQRRI